MSMTNNKNLLVELFVEELPPKALKKLGEVFSQTLMKSLQSRDLVNAGSVVTAYASPRRLAAHISEIATIAPNKEITEKLMPVSVAIKDNQPTDALRKRLAKNGRESLADRWPNAVEGSDSLFIQSDGKVDAVFSRSLAKGASLQVGLEFAVQEALAALPIPKVMTYQLADGWSSVNFVRPAHGLVALHGTEVISISALGLEAGNKTHGHRFEASVDPIVLKDADSYAEQLEKEGAVIANFAARREEIVRQLKVAAAKAGGTPIDDDALLDEVTALVERPNVLIGQFEEVFLEVPQECLILTMKANQKYFPLLDSTGKLTNKFLIVSNIRPADPSDVIGGNERVVRPRLADAKFFFDQDRKKKLADRVSGLDKVVYHNKLGTQGERTARVTQIARTIATLLDENPDSVGRAARLAKADLLTDMVGEFPELQGIMGHYYALHDGESAEVAAAIEDHYKPRFAGDSLPHGKVGTVVALADKLETLVGLFGIGQIPTGDRDPFALRRHALGVIRMLSEGNLPLELDGLLDATARHFSGVGAAFDFKRTALTDFIYERLAGGLRDQGYTAQEVDAVVSQRPQRLGDIPKRLAAVRVFAALPEAASLAAANKRVGNILKKAEGSIPTEIDENLLNDAAEVALKWALGDIRQRSDMAFESGDYAASLKSLAALRAPVDAFFNDVMVNVEDVKLRNNRLALLANLHEAMNRVADLSKLST
jgi:glycyl-tRNA synthetase beta chain